MLALTETQAAALCKTLGVPELMEDARFATRPARMENAAAMQEVLSARFATDDAAEWEARLAEAGVPAARVNTIPQALENPQLQHRDVMLRFPPPPGLEEEVQVPGAGFMAAPDGPGTDRPPPALGQHTDEVLGELGYSAEEIRALREAGAI